MRRMWLFMLIMVAVVHAPLILLGSSDASAASPGYAIVVPSYVSFDPEGSADYAKTGTRVKGELARRGITEVISISSGKSTLQNAIQVWARDRLNTDPSPLYIVVIDHGTPEYFHLGDETVTAAELNSWLETLEAGLTPAARLQKRVVVLGFCYSGGFINDLSRSGRIVITSSDPDEESYRGPMEPDRIRGGEYFVEQLFAELGRGVSLKQAFAAATESIREYLADPAIKSVGQITPFYLDAALQHPLLDDDGDGIGSNSFSDDAGDGLVAKDLTLGPLPPCDQNPSGCPATISAVPESRFLDETTTSALVWAQSSDISRTRWILSDDTGMTYNASSGAWETTETIYPGKNVLAHHLIENNAYLSISPLRTSVVYGGKAGNNPPAPFTLTEPVAGSTSPGILVLRWEEAADPDGDAVTYTVLISRASNFSTIDVRKENLLYPALGLHTDAGLMEGATYYWKVLAVDAYGSITESSQTGSVTIDIAGGIPSLIEGHALSAYSGLPAVGAAVWSTTGGSATSLANGYFVFATMPGSADVTVSAPGYASATKTLTVQQGAGAHLMFPLEPAARPTLTVNVTGPGSGTIESIPAGFSCAVGNSCSGAATAPTMKLVVASAMPHTVFSHWTGACYGTGDCTIRMTADKTVTAVFGAAPGAVTTAASSFADTWAEFSGTVNTNELSTEARFAYRQVPSGAWQYTTWRPVANGSYSNYWVQFSFSVYSLPPLATYEYRIEARNAQGTTLGSSMSVTLKGAAPYVSTGQIFGLTSTAVTLSGTVTPRGNNTVYWFEYGTAPSFGSSTPQAAAGSDPTASSVVSVNLQNLLPRTTYYYRIVAMNQYGTVYGSTGVFYTPYTGTLTGYGMVKDIYAGATSSNPTSLAVLNDTLYFSANSLLHGKELWRSDGTVDGTFLVKEFMPGEASFDPTKLTLHNGYLYFTGSWPTALYKTDGTETGTVGVFSSSRMLYGFIPSGDRVFFKEQDVNYVNKLWTTNGLIISGLQVGIMTAWDQGLLMNATTTAEGEELWKSDGTASGTVLIKDINPGTASSSPSSPIKVGNVWLFSANDGVSGKEVWRTDGTADGTVPVKDICPGACSSTSDIPVVMNDVAYFTANDGVSGYELWRSDGTEAGTYLVKDIIPGGSGSYPTELTVMNNLLLFTVFKPGSGNELWASDGTEAGTMLLRTINPVTNYSVQTWMRPVYGKLYFQANDGVSGNELWVSDGTPNGTYKLYDINAGSGSSNPNQFTPVAGNLFFTATTPATGTELYFLALTTYTVTPVAGLNGSINPGTGQVLSDGAIGRFSITPDPGYHIASVTGCGGALSGNMYITGRITADCSVNASFEPDSFQVTPAAGPNGALEPSVPQTVSRGQSASFTVTPDTGHHIGSVTGCGGTLNGTTYVTGPVTADCTISATFAVNTYMITPAAGPNGILSPSVPQTINHSQTTSFTVAPETGYHIAAVTGCGGTLNGTTYTTGPVITDCTVSAIFAINTYAVALITGANGSISPSTPQTVIYNQLLTLTITPNSGYHIAAVTGCGGTLNGTTYTTGPVTTDCTVSADFAVNMYTLTVSKGGTGSGMVSVSPGNVTCGGTCSVIFASGTPVTLTASPDIGSLFAGWSGSCSGTGICVTTMDAAKTVNATFGKIITVTSPNGGENWRRNTTYTIRWNYAGDPGKNVMIELLKGGVLNKTITKSTSRGSNGNGSYSWKIPNSQATGTDYTIRITSTTTSSYQDTSNSSFTIQ